MIVPPLVVLAASVIGALGAMFALLLWSGRG